MFEFTRKYTAKKEPELAEYSLYSVAVALASQVWSATNTTSSHLYHACVKHPQWTGDDTRVECAWFRLEMPDGTMLRVMVTEEEEF